MSDMGGKDKCVKCSKGVIKDKLCCAICKSICHYKCMGVNDEFMGKVSEFSNFVWLCNGCLRAVENIGNVE